MTTSIEVGWPTAIAVLCAVWTTSAGELVPNPGFESPGSGRSPADWHKWGQSRDMDFVLDDGHARTGKTSLKLTDRIKDGNSYCSSNSIRVDLTKTYVLSCWVRADKAHAARVMSQMLAVKPERRFLGWKHITITAGPKWRPVCLKLNRFDPKTEVIAISLAPTNMRYSETGTVWFDDLSLAEADGGAADFGQWVTQALVAPELASEETTVQSLFDGWQQAMTQPRPMQARALAPLRRDALALLRKTLGGQWWQHRLAQQLIPQAEKAMQAKRGVELALKEIDRANHLRPELAAISQDLEAALAKGAEDADLDRLVLRLERLWLAVARPRRVKTTGVRPRVGIYVPVQGLIRAREIAKTDAGAKRIVENAIQSAQSWLEKPDEWYRETMPEPGALYTYGLAGCPKCKGRWPRFGGGVCSWDRPGKLTCMHCKALLPDEKPGQPYHDHGKGVAISGTTYYLKGTWNAWVINQMYRALDGLVNAYLLTEDDRYAHKACVILDKLATLCPQTKGPVDIRADGRFHHLTSMTNRARMRWCRWFDALYHAAEFQKTSATNPTNFGKTDGGFTIRDNVEQNLVLEYLYGHQPLRGGPLRSLHNHTGDTVRAMLAAGRVTARVDLMRIALDAIYRFYENTVDRDGRYYESAVGYANFTRSLFMDAAEVMATYSPYDYDDPTAPHPSDYSHRLNLFDHPKLQQLVLLPSDRVDCAGYLPGFGDSGDSGRSVAATHRRFDAKDWRALARVFVRATHADARLAFGEALAALCAGDPTQRIGDLWDLYHHGWWQKLPKGSTAPLVLAPRSELIGNKAMGILRSGAGPNRRAAFMRGGTTLAHGHDDLLQLQIFDLDKPLCREIGYGLYGVPTHFGYAARGYAHNLVVVNEEELAGKDPRSFRVEPATVRYFSPGPPFQSMQMDGTLAHRMDGVSAYVRTVVMVGINDKRSYYVDFFDVNGGWGHDYVWHTVGTRGSVEQELAIEGAELAATPNAWTLAGLSGQEDEVYDAPGMSWGERVLPGERIATKPGSPAKYWGWRPPPGNGAGFIFDVKHGDAPGAVSATWNLHEPDGSRVRLTMLPSDGGSVITGRGPHLNGKRFMKWFILRRRGKQLESHFRAVIEPYAGSRAVRAIEPLDVTGPGAGNQVHLHDGREDVILHRWGSGTLRADSLETDARLLMLRRKDGRLRVLKAVGGSFVSLAGRRWRFRGEVQTRVVDVDYENARIVVEGPPRGGFVLSGATALIDCRGKHPYSHTSPYRIRSASEHERGLLLDLGRTTFSLGRGKVLSISEGRLHSDTPFPYAYEPHNRKDTRYFDGKMIRSPNGEALIDSCPSDKIFTVVENRDVRQGDEFEVVDVKPGDTLSLVGELVLEADGPRDAFRVQARGPVSLRWESDSPSLHVKGTSWRAVALRREGAFAEADIALSDLDAGRGLVVIDKPADCTFESALPLPDVQSVEADGVAQRVTHRLMLDSVPSEVRVVLEGVSAKAARNLHVFLNDAEVRFRPERKGGLTTLTIAGLPPADIELKVLLLDAHALFGLRRVVLSISAAVNRSVTVLADPAASGGRAVQFTAAASWLKGTVDLPAATYAVALRGYGPSGGANSMFLEVDGTRLPDIWHLPVGQYGPSSRQWDGSDNTPQVTLKNGGRHTLKITLREAPPQFLDTIVITAPGRAPIEIEAESWAVAR